MDFEAHQRASQELGEALLECVPDGSAGAGLHVRLAAEGARTRVIQELRLAAGPRVPVPERLEAAVRERIALSRREAQSFVAASWAVHYEADSWQISMSFGHAHRAPPPDRALSEGDAFPSTLERLFEQHAVATLCRQRRLTDLVGTTGWATSADGTRIRFERGPREFSAAFLGSAATRLQEWRWGWGIEGADAANRDASERLRECGRRWGVVEFLARDLPLGSEEGHVYATVASGALGFDAYFRCPHARGSAWILIRAPELAGPPAVTPMRLQWAISTALHQGLTRHRTAVLCGARSLGLRTSERAGRSVAIAFPSGGELIVEFDERDRVSQMSASLGPDDL